MNIIATVSITLNDSDIREAVFNHIDKYATWNEEMKLLFCLTEYDGVQTVTAFASQDANQLHAFAAASSAEQTREPTDIELAIGRIKEAQALIIAQQRRIEPDYHRQMDSGVSGVVRAPGPDWYALDTIANRLDAALSQLEGN